MIFPVDSVIHRLNYWGQSTKNKTSLKQVERQQAWPRLEASLKFAPGTYCWEMNSFLTWTILCLPCANLGATLCQPCTNPVPTLHQPCTDPVSTLRQLYVNTSSRFPLSAFSFVGCFHCCHVFWWVLHMQRNRAKLSVRIQCILYRSLSYQTVCGRQEGM